MKNLGYTRIISGLLFSMLALAAAAFSLFRPHYNWDMIGYVAAAKSFEENDITYLQKFTYSEIGKTVSPEKFAALTSGDFRSTISQDPSAFGELLPFYQIRPVYNALIFILYKVGIDIVSATYIISGASTVLSIFLVWLICRERVFGPLLVSIPIFALVFKVLELARYSTPDALATLLLMLSVYLYLGKRYLKLLLILTLMIGVRTDLIIYVFLLAFFLLYQGVGKGYAFMLLIVSLAAYHAIGYHWNNPGWQTIFYYTLVENLTHPITIAPNLDLQDYLIAFVRGLKSALNDMVFITYALVFLFSAWVLGYSSLIKKFPFRLLVLNPSATLIIVCFLYIAIHFIAFPVIWFRFFSGFYLIGFIALMFAMSQSRVEKSIITN